MTNLKRKIPAEVPLSVTMDGEILEPTGTEPEASSRHQEAPLAEVPERDAGQTIPAPLDDHEEPGFQPSTLKFWQPTKHGSR